MKRILACLLAVAMVLVVLMAAGCGETTKTEDTTAAQKSQETTAPAEKSEETTAPTAEDTTKGTVSGEETTATQPAEDTTSEQANDPTKDKMPGFEDLNFNGKTFVIAAQDDTSGDGWYTTKEVYPDSSLTDAISVAVRQRNALIEKLYNCEIKMNESENPVSVVNADITGQKYTVDIYTYEYGCMSSFSSGNNYNLLNYIDTTNPWWDQNYVSALTLKKNDGTNVLCSIVGDFALTSFACTHAMFFNKEVYENSTITDDIYALVESGDWTMDKFVEMVKAIPHDGNGDGEYHYADGDTLGWVRTAHATHGMHVASGLELISNNDGSLAFAVSENAGTWSGIIDKAIDVWSIEGSETIGYTNVQKAVQEGKTLFASEVIDVLERMKDADGLQVGLVPYPKYSAEQDGYSNYVDNHVATYCMPVSVTDPELTGKFFEVYAYHSRYIVREAFINTYAFTYCSDAESYDTLNTILDNRNYDAGYLWWSEFESQVGNMISGGTNNITGFASRYGKTFQTNYTTFVNTVSEKVSD